MIYDYAIKKENDEQVLYIYLDYSIEFAGLNKDKKQKINSKIKHFIKKNRIDFKGKKVVLVASGLVIGTLLLKQPVKDDNLIKININPISILMNKEISNDEKQEEQDLTKNSDVQEQIQDVKEENNKKSNDNVKKDGSKKSSSNLAQNQSNNTIVNNKEENTIQNKEHNIKEDNKTYVKVYRSNGTVLNLELEEYLVGVVGSEMPAEFHEQALMAQAVIARTYALKAISRNIKITDTSSTQNYKSNDELRVMWQNKFDIYYSKVKKAVDNTSGEYLIYNGELIDAVYHSTSNGMTEDSINVWGNSFPYLVSVESPYDELNPSFIKETQITYEILSNTFKKTINQDTEIKILSKTSGNRVDKIEIEDTIYTGVQVRTMLGLRSTDFEIIKNDAGITFKTKGYGHGVGLSQYGTNGMAKNGYSYEQILKHYYTGVTIQK